MTEALAHGRRMSLADAGFYYLERPGAPLHLAGLAILDGSLDLDALAGRIASRVDRAPRYGQVVREAPLHLALPGWEDAPDFDPRAHLHCWDLGGRGTQGELLAIAARRLAEPIDLSRPAWEMDLIDGLEGGRCALLHKVHHCMVDGLAGVRLFERLVDDEDAAGEPAVRTRPVRAPGAPARMAAAVVDELARRQQQARELAASARDAATVRARLGQSAAGLRSLARWALDGVPQLPWNSPVGESRRLSVTRLPLDALQQVRRVSGATLNDVALSVLGGGLARFLTGLGQREERLVAMVPVSLRSSEEAARLGNRLSAIFVPLVLGARSEAERLTLTCELTHRLKTEAAWSGVDGLLQALDLLPSPLLGRIARRVSVGRLANLIATNVRGPESTQRLCGRELLEIYPVVPIAGRIGLGAALFSYAGFLHVGLHADAQRVPDLDKLTDAIGQSFRDLACATGVL